MKSLIKFTLILLFSLSSFQLKAQMTEVPVSFQVNILKKIFVVDRVIKSRGEGIVLIIHDKDNLERAELIQNTFKSLGMKAEIATNFDLVNKSGIHAIYFLTQNIERPKFISDEKILTISGFTQSLEDGKVALGLRNVGGKPEVVLNKSLLRAEGHDELLMSLPKAVVI